MKRLLAALFFFASGCYQPIYILQKDPILDSHTCEEAAAKYDWKNLSPVEQDQAHANLAECHLLEAERVWLYEPKAHLYLAEEQCEQAYAHLQQISEALSDSKIRDLVARANFSCSKIERELHDLGDKDRNQSVQLIPR